MFTRLPPDCPSGRQPIIHRVTLILVQGDGFAAGSVGDAAYNGTGWRPTGDHTGVPGMWAAAKRDEVPSAKTKRGSSERKRVAAGRGMGGGGTNL